jgi:hypothetical protein
VVIHIELSILFGVTARWAMWLAHDFLRGTICAISSFTMFCTARLGIANIIRAISPAILMPELISSNDAVP